MSDPIPRTSVVQRLLGRPRRRRLATSVTAGAGVLAVVLGLLGFHELELGAGEVMYRTIRLFTLNLDVPDGASPGAALWVAAFLAPLTTARVLLELVRGRTRAAVVRHVLRGHVIVCGVGARGALLVRDYVEDGRAVVAIDRQENAAGLLAAAELGAFTVVGDATSDAVLAAAGLARAATIVAITGDDYANASISSLVRERAARDAEVFVHLDDPGLARLVEGPAVVPFSTTAIAGAAALDEAGAGTRVVAADASGRASLVIFGDDPVVDAMVLELHRRWQVERLAGADDRLRPLITLLAPRASQRIASLRRRYGAALVDLELVTHDVAPEIGLHLDPDVVRLLRSCEPVRHAWVVDRDEFAGLRLAVAVSRALGTAVRVTLLSDAPTDVLSRDIRNRTELDGGVADVVPRSLLDLASRAGRLQDMRRAARLARAAEERSGEPVTTLQAAEWLERAGAVFDDPAPIAARWDEPVLAALGLPSGAAFLRAGLRVEVLTTAVAARTGPALLARDRELAFLYYARVASQIDDADALEQLERSAAGDGEAAESVRRLLQLRRRALGRRAHPASRPRYVMVIGGADGWEPEAVARAAERLTEAIERPLWHGVLISGGTTSGIAGAVGGLRDVRTRGYVPASGAAVVRHPGYGDIRAIGVAGFSIAQSLKAWEDVFDEGVEARDVPVLAFPGGSIARQELALAHALGAPVGVIDFDRTGADLEFDDLYGGRRGIVRLPDDGMAIRAFLRDGAASPLDDRTRERLAEASHDAYRASQRGRKPADDPAMQPWPRLSPLLKRSNRAQVDHIPDKLAALGWELVPAGRGADLRLGLPAGVDTGRPFADPELERLARMEHGRWVVERARRGWQDGERRLQRLLTPYLLPWDELDAAAKAWDRDVIANLPALLAAADLQVAPLPQLPHERSRDASPVVQRR